MWAGIAGAVVNNNTGYELAISIHDSVYNTDFASSVIPYTASNPEAQASEIEKHVLEGLRKFSTEHMCKFLGAGVTVSLLREVRVDRPAPASRGARPNQSFGSGSRAAPGERIEWNSGIRNSGIWRRPRQRLNLAH